MTAWVISYRVLVIVAAVIVVAMTAAILLLGVAVAAAAIGVRGSVAMCIVVCTGIMTSGLLDVSLEHILCFH